MGAGCTSVGWCEFDLGGQNLRGFVVNGRNLRGTVLAPKYDRGCVSEPNRVRLGYMIFLYVGVGHGGLEDGQLRVSGDESMKMENGKLWSQIKRTAHIM